MDPHHGRIVLNGAPSQYSRALEPAVARRVRVDGRSQAELRRFAVRFGELVWFYGLDDRPDGDWSAFFLADPATLAAAIRRAVPRGREAALAGQVRQLRETGGAEEKRELLRGLFAAPHGLARQVDAWLRVLAELAPGGPALRLHLRLSEAVSGHLGPGLRRLRGWDAGAGARDGVGGAVGLDYDGFLPLWELGAAPAPDASVYRGATAGARMDHAAPRVAEAYAAFADALHGVARGAAELRSPEGGQQPQLALYAAFVALFRTAQRTLNSLTPRYAGFYYHQVLREGLRGPVPDRLYLAFALAPEAGGRTSVAAGTLFPAGNDAAGQEVLYAADRGVAVTAATLARILVLRAVPGPLVAAFVPAGSPPLASPPSWPDEEPVPVQRVLASAVPAEAASGADPAATGWPTFGTDVPGTEGPQVTGPATLGFAVASPQLLLTGGNRCVAVTVRFEGGRELQRRLGSVAQLTGATPADVLKQVVAGAFTVDLSTAEGWFTLDGYRVLAGQSLAQGSFSLGLELPAGAPAIVPLYAGGEPPADPPPGEPLPNPAPGLPTLAARLRPGTLAVTGWRGTAAVHPLPFLEGMEVRAVDVRCWVRGLAGVALANTDGEVGPGGPFPVFGATPAVGGFLDLRSVELFTKVPRDLSVTVSWLAPPPNDTGFEGWYRGYLVGLDGVRTRRLFDNQVFRGRLRVMNPGHWQLRAPGSPDPLAYEPVYLFRTRDARDACDAAVPRPAAALCPDTLFAKLPVAPAAAPAYYDPSSSALRLELSDPPYAFGNDLYAANVLDAVLRDLPNPTACEASCTAACGPLQAAAAGLARCLAECDASPPGDPCVECLAAVRDGLEAAAAECQAGCAAASPPGPCDRCARMEQGVARIDACIARAASGVPVEAEVEVTRAWLADAYTLALTACINTCMRPGTIRYPNEPWLPQAQRVSVDYSSGCCIEPGLDGGRGALFHLEPFGGWRAMAADGPGGPTLLPRAGKPAGLLLGFDALPGGDTLTLLFQLAVPGLAEEPATPPAVEWSRLEGNAWEPLPADAVQVDTTHGLRNSGIVALELEPFAASAGTRIPGGQHWLRCSALGQPEGFPWTVSLLPHATTATRVESGGAQPAEPLPAGTIAGTVQDVAGLGAVLQPMPSFGGRPAEVERTYQLRLAERLRHKDRAAQPWDYERLVLERFPQVWKAQALPARGTGGPAPGSVLVVVVPSESGNESSDTAVPRASTALLGTIQDYLAQRASPFATIQVVNPAYVRVRVHAEVAFRTPGTGGDSGGGLDRLNADLVAYLSPWFYDAERATREGSYALEGDISQFIQSRPYVDTLLSLRLEHDPEPGTLEWYFLTSANAHVLRERTFTGSLP